MAGIPVRRAPPRHLQTLILLLFCGIFAVYRVQDAATFREDVVPRRPPIMPSWRIAGAEEDGEEEEESLGNDFAVFHPWIPPNGTESKSLSVGGSNGTSALWVTMGLCWSSNTKYHDKKDFPYREAAPLSIQLWTRMAEARVIILIVYSEESVPPDLGKYKGNFTSSSRLTQRPYITTKELNQRKI